MKQLNYKRIRNELFDMIMLSRCFTGELKLLIIDEIKEKFKEIQEEEK